MQFCARVGASDVTAIFKFSRGAILKNKRSFVTTNGRNLFRGFFGGGGRGRRGLCDVLIKSPSRIYKWRKGSVPRQPLLRAPPPLAEITRLPEGLLSKCIHSDATSVTNKRRDFFRLAVLNCKSRVKINVIFPSLERDGGRVGGASFSPSGFCGTSGLFLKGCKQSEASCTPAPLIKLIEACGMGMLRPHSSQSERARPTWCILSLWFVPPSLLGECREGRIIKI